MAGEPTAGIEDRIIDPTTQADDYLKKALTRTPKGKENSFLYRYTKIQYLVDMLKSGYMRLGSCDDMNDPFETAILQRHGILRKLFYACFTKASESLAMYQLYGTDKDSVLIKISYSDLEKILISNSTSETVNRFSPTHSFMILRENEPTKEFVEGISYCTAVGYVDPETMAIHTGSKEITGIRHPFMQSKLAGKIKYRCWEYEDEMRLCAELTKELAENECVAIKLPSDFDSIIGVTLCPGFDSIKNKELLLELNLRSIRAMPSVYDPLYTAFLEKKEIPTYEGTYHEKKKNAVKEVHVVAN